MIQIRQESPNDYRETENLIREAFWNYYAPGCTEHYLVRIMRNCPAFVPKLALVAVAEKRVVGASYCLRGTLHGDDGKDYEILTLGPIGILPEYQSQGIGAALLERSKEIARELGFRAILLTGDPDYYLRRGFVPAENYGIRNAENMYADALHACALYEGALSSLSGIYTEDDIYNLDPEAAERFDADFPPKEKVLSTPSQKKLEVMITRVKPYQG